MIELTDLLATSGGFVHGPVFASRFLAFSYDTRLLAPAIAADTLAPIFVAVKIRKGGWPRLYRRCRRAWRVGGALPAAGRPGRRRGDLPGRARHARCVDGLCPTCLATAWSDNRGHYRLHRQDDGQGADRGGARLRRAGGISQPWQHQWPLRVVHRRWRAGTLPASGSLGAGSGQLRRDPRPGRADAAAGRCADGHQRSASRDLRLAGCHRSGERTPPGGVAAIWPGRAQRR